MPTGYTQVSGSALKDSTDTLVANATISFQPVSNAGVPISFRAGGGGQTISKPVTATVTNGAFTIQLADSTLTTPLNVGYRVTVTDNLTGDSLLGSGYGCVQPSGATWNWDAYDPNLTAQVTTQYGPIGPQGLGILAAEINNTNDSLQFGAGQAKTITHGLATDSPLIYALVNDATPAFDAVPSDFQMGSFILTATSAGIIDTLKILDSSLVTTGTVTSATLNTNRVAYWPMNEGSGPTFHDSVADLTVASNLGPALYSNAHFTWVGGKASFSGYLNPLSGASTEGVSSLACLNNNGPLSISFGMNLGALTTPTQITLFSNVEVGSTNGLELIVGTNGTLQIVFINGGGNPTSNILAGTTAAGAIGTGTRHRLIYTYDGSGTVAGINIYVDGVAKPITAATGITNNISGVIVPSLAMVFMSSPSGGGIDSNNAAVGVMDDFSIWDAVISTDQRALLT